MRRLKKYIDSLFRTYILFFKKTWPEIIPLLIFRVGSKIIDLSSSVLGYICIAVAIGIAGEEIFTAKLRALQIPDDISDKAIWLVILLLVVMSIINLIIDKLALYYMHKILHKNGQATNLNAKPHIVIENLEKSILPLVNFIDFLSELIFLLCMLLVVLVLSPVLFIFLILAGLSAAGIRKLIPVHESPNPQNAYHRSRLDVLHADPDAEGRAVGGEKIDTLASSRIDLTMHSRRMSASRSLFSSGIFIILVMVILNVDTNIKAFSWALLFLLVIRQIGVTIMNMVNYNKHFVESI